MSKRDLTFHDLGWPSTCRTPPSNHDRLAWGIGSHGAAKLADALQWPITDRQDEIPRQKPLAFSSTAINETVNPDATRRCPLRVEIVTKLSVGAQKDRVF